MKTKGLLFVIVLLFCSGIVFAGIEPDEINFFPVQPQAGMMVNLNYSPAIPACSDAAPSYLKPNMPVRLTEKIWFGNIIGTEKLDYLGLLTYFNALLGAVKNDAYRLSPQAGVGNQGMVLAQNAITNLSEGAIVQTTGEYTCLSIHGGTAMFWQVNANGQIGWLIESIRWENVVLELQSQANNQNAPLQVSPIIKFQLNLNAPQVQFNPLQGQVNIKPITTLSSMEAYYLTPHVYTPSEGMTGGTQLTHNDCDNAAPSRLTLGEKAYYMGHIVNNSAYNPAKIEQLYNTVVGYARFNLGNAPLMPAYISLPWNQTSLVDLTDTNFEELFEQLYGENAPQNTESEEAPSLIADNNFLKVPIPVGQLMDVVVSGPLCTRRSEWIDKIEVINGDIVDLGYEMYETFVWWQVDLTLLGLNLDKVWIAESITRQAPWGRIDYYLLSPDSFNATTINIYDNPLWIPNDIRPTLEQLGEQSSCIGILPSTLFSGSLAQPNGSAMNLRAVPDGDVIGRVGADEQIHVYGDSLCWNGYRWWLTGRGGWIAENSRTTALLVPAVQRVAPPVVEETTVAPISTPDFSAPTPEPTRPVEEPTQPPRPTCDVITGANC